MADASYRDIAKSLRIFHHLTVDHSTVRRAIDHWQDKDQTA
jgi:hypothetical protein